MSKKKRVKFTHYKPKHAGEVIVDAESGDARAKKIECYFASLRKQFIGQGFEFPMERVPVNQPKQPSLKIEIDLSHSQQASEVIEALSDSRLLDKVSVKILPVFSQPRPSLRPVVTSHVCYVERLADNTLRCKVCGQKLPSTRAGEIDRERLAEEMLLPTWNCRHQ